MTTERYLLARVFPLSVELIGVPSMYSPEAGAMLMAIARQESGWRHREQHGDGPALGFWQFEPAGIRGVLQHPKTRPLILPVLETMRVEPYPTACHEAVEHNDVLAMVFARLNLWWLPHRLPKRTEPAMAWRQYLTAWNPGEPRPVDWPDNWVAAWGLVDAI